MLAWLLPNAPDAPANPFDLNYSSGC